MPPRRVCCDGYMDQLRQGASDSAWDEALLTYCGCSCCYYYIRAPYGGGGYMVPDTML